MKERLFNAGMETIAGTPEQLSAVMKVDVARLGRIIRDAGIRAN